jgi:hypothetical protein
VQIGNSRYFRLDSISLISLVPHSNIAKIIAAWQCLDLNSCAFQVISAEGSGHDINYTVAQSCRRVFQCFGKCNSIYGVFSE